MNDLVKLNLACGNTLFGSGWINIDIRRDIAHRNQEIFLSANLKKKIPFQNDTANIIYVSHFLEHLEPFTECPNFLNECSRVLKPTGVLRISVPDFHQIANIYLNDPKLFYKEYGYNKEWFNKVKTWNRRLGISVTFGHKMLYDIVSLTEVLEDAGFAEITLLSHHAQGLLPKNVSKEIVPTHVSHSLIVDCKNNKK